jgi:glutamate formiminotransferase
MPLLECVPNVSEGRERARIDAWARTIREAGGQLLDVHADPDHNRSVFTFLGPAETVERAALALARAVVEAVDLRIQRGGHPRIGAIDVLPLVPLRGASMADAVGSARRLGASLATALHLPVYYFGAAATRPERAELPSVRAGQFEGLAARMAGAAGRPDAGPATPHPSAGAVAVGARRILIAFNAVLDSPDFELAARVARAIRASAGGLPEVRAIAVRLPSRGVVQVSMNLLAYRRTGLSVVMDAVDREAASVGLTVLEFELVGCAPADALDGVDRTRIRWTERQLLDLALLGPESV